MREGSTGGRMEASAGPAVGPAWRRLAGMDLLFWSAAVLVAFPGRMLPQHVLLLWAVGIAILWGGALPLALLRAKDAGRESAGWEMGALVEGAPGGVVEAALSALREMGAEGIEGSAATGAVRARLPGRPAVRLRLHVLAEGAAGETVRAADVVGTDIGAALDLLTNPLRLAATLRS